MKVIDYIRESCEMQNATEPNDFIGMALAYQYAFRGMYLIEYNRDALICMGDMPTLICNVRAEPQWVEFRCMPAVFANGNITTVNTRETILRTLKMLIESYRILTPIEFYKMFEEIHPWDDGNGRVGSLLFNLVNGTIMDPIHPPKIW